MRDYEDLVKSLRYCAEYDCTTVCPRAGTGNGCITRLKKEAADAIEELSKPRWIPVTERLPGYGDKCLAVIRRDDGKQRVGISYCFVQREGFWSDKGADWNVTHWMPLPEPPKVEP